MLVSYKWLQSYFKEELPMPEKVGERLTLLSFEVESIEAIDRAERDGTKPTRNETEKDYVLDLKVLPDRACYALSHHGIAYELAAGLCLNLIVPKWRKNISASGAALPDIYVETEKICTRFVGRRITNLDNNRPSPKWMQDFLASLGQRSINAIVDVTNFVMFDIGRPLHTFDAKKVEGRIVVRFAKEGETITTLDNKEVKLDPSIVVLADDDGPLALAGIKGGNRSGVTEETTEVILEAANWDATYIRKTSTRLGIRTDASKRFENRVPPLYALEGVAVASSLIVEHTGTTETRASESLLIGVASATPRTLSVPSETIIKRVGFPVTVPEILSALKRLGISGSERKGVLELSIPHFRLDLNIPEDIIEEVARIIGYDKIEPHLPPKSTFAEIPKSFYYEWKIREFLINRGFSEVMTSSFMPHGDVQIENPLAEDKRYARSELWWGFHNSLVLNNSNSPLFGSSEIKQFEIGKVFTKSGEFLSLAIGSVSKKGAKQIVESVVSEIEKMLSVKLGGKIEGGRNVYECNLDKVIENLPEPRKWDISISTSSTEKFIPFSPYPFIVRDVAVFVSPDTDSEAVSKIIKKNAGELVIRGPELFDEFSKDGKNSLAFRLVFQSFGRTLSDDEVNKAMEDVYSALKAQGWKVR